MSAGSQGSRVLRYGFALGSALAAVLLLTLAATTLTGSLPQAGRAA